MNAIKKEFDRLKKQWDLAEERLKDPVSLVYSYNNLKDREVAGFLISSIAYGRREIIIKNGKELLKRLGDSPYKTLTDKDTDFKKIFKGFVHRLNSSDDFSILCSALRDILLKYGSLENLFKSCLKENDWLESLRCFVKTIRDEMAKKTDKKNIIKRAFNLVPLPYPGAAKRLNLFLKWMIRKDKIDPGVWEKNISKYRRHLVVPLDVHVANISRKIGWIKTKSVNWNTALTVTEHLKKFCKEDPLRYDFSLCHYGMDCFRRKRV